MQLTPHQPITIPSINLQPRTSTFDWYVYRGQVKVADVRERLNFLRIMDSEYLSYGEEDEA